MSAGAPFLICVSSTFEPAKLYCWARVVGLEHLGQRGGGIDRQRVGLRPARRGGRESERDGEGRGDRGWMRCVFIGRLLAKVGLDRVARGLDVDGGRERDADDAAARELPTARRPAGRHSPPCSRTASRYEGIEIAPRRPGRRRGAARATRQTRRRRRLRARERAVRPGELEVLRDRGGLAGVGQQLPERRRVLARVQTRRERARAPPTPRDELRRGRLRVEVLEEELGRLAEVRVRELVVGRGERCERRSRARRGR